MLFWILIGSGLALALLGLAAAPASTVRKRSPRKRAPEAEESEDPLDLLARDAPAALLRYGTPDDVEYLRQTGRGDDLHGLGYRD